MNDKEFESVIANGASGLTNAQLAVFLQKIINARWILLAQAREAYDIAIS